MFLKCASIIFWSTTLWFAAAALAYVVWVVIRARGGVFIAVWPFLSITIFRPWFWLLAATTSGIWVWKYLAKQ